MTGSPTSITLDDATGGDEIFERFKHDADYEENEQKYGAIKSELHRR